MCRMIAARGTIDARALRLALRSMAANQNSRHDHEHRGKGEAFRHEDGWGAAWMDGGVLRIHRDPRSILAGESGLEIDGVRTDLLVLHARRATSPNSVRAANTHPFTVQLDGVRWAFCHNGAIDRPELLRALPGRRPQGGTDSERLFHHLLAVLRETQEGSASTPDARAAEERRRDAILSGLEPVRDYTAMHAFLIEPGCVYAIAARHPERSKPQYHALWEGRREDLRVISSEPVAGLGELDWSRLPEPSVTLLR